MAYGKEIVTYKNQIASTILNDNEIVSMITEIIPPEKPVEELYAIKLQWKLHTEQPELII